VEVRGGTDKGADGHRRDTIPICNAIIERGWACYPLFYSDAEYDTVKADLETAQGIIVRINPGTYEGVTQARVDALMREMADVRGISLMQHPDVMIKMGTKNSLVKVRNLACGLPDTYSYFDVASFKENFPKTIKTGIRVLKQNRGSQGEGIWVCQIKEGQEGEVTGATVLCLQEAVDNHKEERTIDDFMNFCEKYIVGEDGLLVDMRFLPRIVEGEVRVNMIYDKPVEIVKKTPVSGGISATLASGARYVSHQPDDPEFAHLMHSFVDRDLPQVMDLLELRGKTLPLIWTADFILGDKVDGQDTYSISEFNCSCVGITQQLHLTGVFADAAIRIALKA
jgi:hypothetical protein